MPLPYAWRITKYDPALRDSQGCFPLGNWTSLCDIGGSFSGKKVTYGEYFSCETAYAQSALSFLAAAGLDSLRVLGLENPRLPAIEAEELRDIQFQPSLLKRNSVLRGRELEDVIRLNLREVLWCKLVEKSRFYLHFGYDFYMYVGSASPSEAAIRLAQASGLFVEEMISPYL